MHTSGNNVAYVIGGGPSLKGFDFERLRGRPCYSANKSAKFTPWGHLVSMDRDFIFNSTGLIASFGDRAHLAPPDNIRDRNPAALHYFRSKARTLFDPDPPDKGPCLPGLNSGFAALGLAVRHGYKNISLLGIDMIPNVGHFHDGYSWNNGRDGITREWIADFEQAAIDCKNRGVRVINFSPGSSVQGFPKMPLYRVFYDIFQEEEKT